MRQGATLHFGMAPIDAAGLDWGNAAACARKPVIQEVTFPLHQQDKLPVFVVERLNLVKILNGGERRFWLIRPWKQPMTAE